MNIRTLFTNSSDGTMKAEQNRKDFLKKIKLPYLKDCFMNLVHGNKIVIADSDYGIQTCDGLITNDKNCALFVHVADCIPALLYDDKEKVIAAIHAGREGVFKNIAANIIDSFRKSYESQIKNIKCVIGSHICFKCYEVSQKMADFVEENFGKSFVNHRYIDLLGIFKKQLLDKGVLESNIIFNSVCTLCDKENTVFSYRKDKTDSRFAGVIYFEK